MVHLCQVLSAAEYRETIDITLGNLRVCSLICQEFWMSQVRWRVSLLKIRPFDFWVLLMLNQNTVLRCPHTVIKFSICFFVVGLSCSTCMTSLYGGTNNLSRSYSDESNFFDKTKDKESTQIHHPEEDYSTAAFVSAVSLHSMNLPIAEMGNSQSSVFSATLPGPGDPGAPPLPPELQSDQQEPCTGSSDNCFLPLRSRSVQPQWTQWLSSGWYWNFVDVS